MAGKDPFTTDPWADGADPLQEMLARQSQAGPAAKSTTAPPVSEDLVIPPPPPSADVGSSAALQEYARRSALPKSTVIHTVALTLGVIGLIAVWGALETFGSSAPDTDTYVEPPATLEAADVVGDQPAEVGTQFFVEGFDSIVVGVDVAPGVYVAPYAADLPAGECWWTLQGQVPAGSGEAFIYGQSGGFEPLVVLGEGLTFDASGCAEWVAIDPATAFEGATAESFRGDAVAYGGRDLLPGTYLGQGPAGEASECSVRAVDAYAALAGSYGRFATVTTGGTAIIDVRVGEQVSSFGCATFERVNLAQVVARDEGESSFAGEGTFLVGVDVVAGTYGTSRAPAECSLTVYADYLMWESPVADLARWYGSDQVGAIPLTVGETVYVWGCPDFELAG